MSKVSPTADHPQAPGADDVIADDVTADDVTADDVTADDAIEVLDDLDVEAEPQEPAPVWRVLVIDDDPQIHRSTVFALNDLTVFGRRFSFAHAYSAAEARTILRGDSDFAVILLDVVMESERAGLDLVEVIRVELGMVAPRVILRTGQPGYAPEMTVIQAYDIDDYRSKAELTQVRLFTTIVSALRSYQQIQTIETSRCGLRRIIDAAADLGRRHQLVSFAEGVLIQIGGLLGLACEGIVLARINHPAHLPAAQAPPGESGGEGQPFILAASGRFASLAGAPLSRIADPLVVGRIHRALDGRASLYEARHVVLHIVAPSGDDIAVHFSIEQSLSEVARELLQVFTVNIAVGFDNANMFEHIEMLAFFDPLTRLANRFSFYRAVTARLAAPDGGDRISPAVFILAVDNFEQVTSGLGGETGDRLLKAIARQLESLFGAGHSLARLSDDSFGVMAPVAGEVGERQVLETIRAGFQSPFSVMGNDIPVSITIGYSVAGPEVGDADTLFRQASMALARARSGGRGRAQRFAAAMENELRDRLTLVSFLGPALLNREFELYYQPQVRLIGADGAPAAGGQRRPLTGFEALLRWRRADGVLIPPDVFIPAAEESGRIVEIGEWVLTEACRRQRRWRDLGQPSLRMAVNVSARQMRETGFLAMVERVIAETAADPALLELELTESLELENNVVLEIMKALRGMGIAIAIDDFGTGYSSLSRLHQLPVDHIKIDRSFVAAIGNHPEHRGLVPMIVKAGHELGLAVIAEGVETAAQERELIRLGCQEAQGYLYGRPEPVGVIEHYLGISDPGVSGSDAPPAAASPPS